MQEGDNGLYNTFHRFLSDFIQEQCNQDRTRHLECNSSQADDDRVPNGNQEIFVVKHLLKMLHSDKMVFLDSHFKPIFPEG